MRVSWWLTLVLPKRPGTSRVSTCLPQVHTAGNRSSRPGFVPANPLHVPYTVAILAELLEFILKDALPGRQPRVGREARMLSCDYNGWTDVPEAERESVEAFELTQGYPAASVLPQERQRLPLGSSSEVSHLKAA